MYRFLRIEHNLLKTNKSQEVSWAVHKLRNANLGFRPAFLLRNARISTIKIKSTL